MQREAVQTFGKKVGLFSCLLQVQTEGNMTCEAVGSQDATQAGCSEQFWQREAGLALVGAP